jgi:hypothetical protein
MRKNGRACRVQPFVSVCVVEVPVRIDEVLYRTRVDRCEGVAYLDTRAGIAGINQKLLRREAAGG